MYSRKIRENISVSESDISSVVGSVSGDALDV